AASSSLSTQRPWPPPPRRPPTRPRPPARTCSRALPRAAREALPPARPDGRASRLPSRHPWSRATRSHPRPKSARRSFTRMRVADRLDRLPLTGFHYRLLLLSGFGWLFDSMDGGLMSFVLARLRVEWSLSPDQIAVASSAGLAGMFLGGAVAGSLADRFGRKAVFQATLLIFSISTGLCALAQGAVSLILLRFLVGFGLGGELPVAAALVSEFAPARHRGRLVVLLESFWAFGWAAAAIIAELLARRA